MNQVIILLLLLTSELQIPSLNIQNFLRITITAYSPDRKQCDSTPFITATNTKVKEGIVAVSRSLEKLYPMGSIIEIEGKQYQVKDRMSKKWQDYRADVFFWNKKEALEWGRKTIILLNFQPDNLR